MVIGGTSLYGGQGNILRTIIGVVIIALIRNFLNLSRIDIFWQDFATGAIIVGAVLLDASRSASGVADRRLIMTTARPQPWTPPQTASSAAPASS